MTVPVELHSDLLEWYADESLFSSMSDLFCSALRWYMGEVYDQIIVERYMDWINNGKQGSLNEYAIYKERETPDSEYDCFKNLVSLYKEQTCDYKPGSSRLQMTVPVGLLHRSEMLYDLCRMRIKSIDYGLFKKMNYAKYYTIILAAYICEIKDSWQEIIDLGYGHNATDNNHVPKSNHG